LFFNYLQIFSSFTLLNIESLSPDRLNFSQKIDFGKSSQQNGIRTEFPKLLEKSLVRTTWHSDKLNSQMPKS